MILGIALAGVGATTALLSTAPGFALDMFDIAIGVVGIGLLLHGATRARRDRHCRP